MTAGRCWTDVDAAFRRGIIYAVVGESGCGKCTLFDALAGLCRYSRLRSAGRRGAA